jgi:phosphomannomutase/phosphoglucomutase
MSPHCADDVKYEVVERVTAHYRAVAEAGGTVAGQPIRDIVTVNGVRFALEDGGWGLVRASSNKPELVVVVESPVSEEARNAIFRDIEALLGTYAEVGEYNQRI